MVKDRPGRPKARTTGNSYELSTQVARDPPSVFPSRNTLTLMSRETMEDDRTEENRKAEAGPPNCKSSPYERHFTHTCKSSHDTPASTGQHREEGKQLQVI